MPYNDTRPSSYAYRQEEVPVDTTRCWAPKLDGPTGWAKVAKVLRDLQGRKARGCSDDMDTLLVFVSHFQFCNSSIYPHFRVL